MTLRSIGAAITGAASVMRRHMPRNRCDLVIRSAAGDAQIDDDAAISGVRRQRELQLALIGTFVGGIPVEAHDAHAIANLCRPESAIGPGLPSAYTRVSGSVECGQHRRRGRRKRRWVVLNGLDRLNAGVFPMLIGLVQQTRMKETNRVPDAAESD